MRACCMVSWYLNEAEKITVPKKYVPGSVGISFLQDLAKLSTEDDGPIKAREYLLTWRHNDCRASSPKDST